MSNDGQRLVLSSLAATAASCMLQASSFLIFACLSRWLPPGDLGTYRQLMIVQSLPSFLVALGIPDAMLYAVARASDARERDRAFAGGLVWMIVNIPIAGLASGGLTLLIARLAANPALADVFIFACLLGGLNTCLLFAPAVFMGRQQSGRLLGFASLQLATGVALTLGLSWFSPTLSTAIFAAILTAAQGMVLTLLAFVPAARTGSLIDLANNQIASFLRYGYPIAIGGFLYMAGYQVDHFVASVVFLDADYGIYAGGAWQLPIARLAQQGQAVTLLSTLAAHHRAGNDHNFWDDWLRLARPAGVAGTFLFWGVLWTAPEIIELALGARYRAGAAVFRVYALLLLLRMVAVNLPLRAHGFTRAEIGAGLALAVTSLCVGFGIGDALGLMGPALGMLTGMCVWISMILWATKKSLGISITQFLPFKLLLVSLLVTGLNALASFVLLCCFDGAAAFERLAGFWGVYAVLSLITWWLPRALSRSRNGVESER